VIGENGIKLSCFQKQRLGIVRALIKNTKIILLAEVEYYEKENYILINKIINNIENNHTIIVVIHELLMIKESNRILVLDNGKIVGDGKHNELLEYKINDIFVSFIFLLISL